MIFFNRPLMHIDNKRPLCNGSRIISMPIFYDENYRLDHNTMRGRGP